MADRKPRRYVPVRLGPNYERIVEMADQETEGNVSQMIRKLLAEAITARDARTRR